MGIKSTIVSVSVIVVGLTGVLAVSTMAQSMGNAYDRVNFGRTRGAPVTDTHDSSRMSHIVGHGSGAACVNTHGHYKLMTVNDDTLLVTDKTGAGAVIQVSGCGLERADHVAFMPRDTVCEVDDVKVQARSEGDGNSSSSCYIDAVRQVSADEAASLATTAQKTS